MKFTEAQLEQAFIELLAQEGHKHYHGETIERSLDQVLIDNDLITYLKKRYASHEITDNEIRGIIKDLRALPSSDLYESNKKFMNRITDGFILKREDASQKDLYIQLIDYTGFKNTRNSVKKTTIIKKLLNQNLVIIQI